MAMTFKWQKPSLLQENPEKAGKPFDTMIHKGSSFCAGEVMESVTIRLAGVGMGSKTIRCAGEGTGSRTIRCAGVGIGSIKIR